MPEKYRPEHGDRLHEALSPEPREVVTHCSAEVHAHTYMGPGRVEDYADAGPVVENPRVKDWPKWWRHFLARQGSRQAAAAATTRWQGQGVAARQEDG